MASNLSSITLKEVHSRADLRRFVDFPHEIYRDHPNWVPALRSDDLNTLRRDKNPAFEFCEARYWLAVKGNETVGRIAGIINYRAIDKWEKPYARFGWVDFIDDAAVVKALLGVVEDYAAEKELKAVHGPLGFTDLDREGMLVEGFDKLGTLATIYNYSYYPRHMEAAGYRKDIDWVEYLITVPENGVERIDKLAEVVRRRYSLSYLEARHKKDLLRYACQMFDLLDETYAHLYGTTFLTKDQKKAYTKQYFGFISPDFVPVFPLIVEPAELLKEIDIQLGIMITYADFHIQATELRVLFPELSAVDDLAGIKEAFEELPKIPEPDEHMWMQIYIRYRFDYRSKSTCNSPHATSCSWRRYFTV